MHDLIVIGAGAAGLAASKRAAQAGKKVLLIENDSIGGHTSGTSRSSSGTNHRT